MSDEGYDHLDHIEIVDQEPVTEREVRSEERERVRFLAEDRLSPEERRDLEARALEGAEEAEIYEASWTPSHDADLDEIHDRIDHEIGEGGQRRSAGSRTVDPSAGGALATEDRDRLARATPGDLIAHNVEYRTDNGAVVSLRYRAKDGREATTLANVGPDSVRFLDDIRSELDDQKIDLEALDVEAPAPPGDQPGPDRRPSRPEPEPEPELEEPSEEEETDQPEEPDETEETDELVQELTVEPETESDEEDWDEEDRQLAEELGLSPEELSDLTEDEDEESGGLGGKLGFGGKKEEPSDQDAEDASGGGIGDKLPFGKKKKDAGDEADEGEGGGIGDNLPFGKKKKDAGDEADEEGGGIGDKLPFGKKKGDDAEDADDEEDEEGGGIGDKLPFG